MAAYYLEIDEDNSSRAVAFFLMHPIFNEEERMLSMALLIFGRDDDVRTQIMKYLSTKKCFQKVL